MSALQGFLQSILPRRWAESCEAESREWMARCPCGYEESVWERGGVRWKALGRPRRWLVCPYCGELAKHVIYRATHEEDSPAGER